MRTKVHDLTVKIFFKHLVILVFGLILTTQTAGETEREGNLFVIQEKISQWVDENV